MRAICAQCRVATGALVFGVALGLTVPTPCRAQFAAVRAGELVSLEGRLVPRAYHVPVAQLSVVRVRHGIVEPIPFQIDERDAQGQFALPEGPERSSDESPGVFDDNDELVLAAGDVGERADVPDAVEVQVSEPTSGATGFAYLQRGTAGAPPPRDDVRYDADTDTVSARRYTLVLGVHTPNGFAFVDPGGRPGLNLLDRVKARVTARILWGMLEFHRDEDDITTTVLAWKDGPLRVIRRARLSIRLGYGLPAPEFIAEDVFTSDTFSGPVLVRLPFDLRYVFGDLLVRIFLDFEGLDDYRLFTAGNQPEAIGCHRGAGDLGGRRTDWFGMTGPAGTFVHALRFGPTLRNTVESRLFVTAAAAPDPPERVPGNCPGVGYELTHWAGVGRGTHQIDMVIRAFDHYQPGDEQAFLAALDQPLRVGVTGVKTDLAEDGARTAGSGAQ